MRLRLYILIGASFCVAVAIIAGNMSPIRARRGAALAVTQSQTGSPVMLVGAKSTRHVAFSLVRVRNKSAHAIRAITFGVLLHPIGALDLKPLLLSTRIVRVAIAPEADQEAAAEFVPLSVLRDRIRHYAHGVIAELGVLSVQFQDGSEWTYDVRVAKQFRSADRPFALRQLRPCGKPTILGASLAEEPDEYRCVEGEEWTLCESDGNSCEVQECYGPDCRREWCAILE